MCSASTHNIKVSLLPPKQRQHGHDQEVVDWCGIELMIIESDLQAIEGLFGQALACSGSPTVVHCSM
jgi:hypothetical protein